MKLIIYGSGATGQQIYNKITRGERSLWNESSYMGLEALNAGFSAKLCPPEKSK